MSSQPDPPPFQEKDELHQFASFLTRQREQITERWMEEVKRSPKVESANPLDYHELADHLPKLFQDLADGLDSKGVFEEETHDDAESHGRHRWQQDYSLGELLRELGIVRHMILVHGLDAFEDGSASLSRAGRRRIRECILRFFEETAAASTEQFVAEQHQQLQVMNSRLQEAGRSLKAVNDRLNEADASRLLLLRTVSHELRNTLDALNGAVMVLGLDGIEDAERQKMFMICHRNLTDMGQLLRELTDYAMLLDKQPPVNVEEFSPALLCDELTAAFRPVAEVEGMTFEAYSHPALQEIRSDRLKIKQVLTNLITNAIKYRKPGAAAPGRIKLAFLPARSAGQWEMSVEDDGIGIAPEHLETIFEEFQRVAPERAKIQGAGLGLAITKRLIGLLGGGISVTSEVDQGSCFKVDLPKSLAG